MHYKNISTDFSVLSRYRSFLYGCSALWILWFHCVTRIPSKGILIPFRFLQDIGNCGVEIFLLLSGFGLYHSLEKNSDILNFYKKRLLRVFLPSFLAMSVVNTVNDSSLLTYLGSSTLVGYWFGIPTIWYAAFILTMYLFYPLLYALQKKNARNIVILLALSLLFSFFSETFQLAGRDIQRGISRIPIFLAGCLIAPYVAQRRALPKWTLPMSFAFTILLSALWKVAKKYGYRYFFRSLAYAGYAVLAIACLCLIAWILVRYTKLRGIYRWISFIGEISLEVYLIFERMEGLLNRLPGFHVHSCGGIKLDIAAAIFTLILAVLLQTVTRNIIKSVESCPVPENNT